MECCSRVKSFFVFVLSRQHETCMHTTNCKMKRQDDHFLSRQHETCIHKGQRRSARGFSLRSSSEPWCIGTWFVWFAQAAVSLYMRYHLRPPPPREILTVRPSLPVRPEGFVRTGVVGAGEAAAGAAALPPAPIGAVPLGRASAPAPERAGTCE